MKVTDFSISHSTTVYALIVILTIGGWIAYQGLPREAAPDIAIPIVIVSTPYFGVSPADIETLVTQPLEKEFTALRGLKKMTSTSAESVSLITLEFEPDVVIDDALQKIRDKVDKAKPDLPPDAEDPEIIEINSSDWPVLIANVSGDMDPVRLKELAEDIQDDIEKQPGVLRVDLAGGVEREIQVLVDPQKLLYHNVSLNDVITKIQAENINLPGGSIDVGPMKYTVRVPGEFENVQMMEDLVVKAPDGNPVYLRDIAKVVDTYKEPKTYSRLTTWKEVGGQTVQVTQTNVSLSVVKRAGENIIDIAEASRRVIKDYESRVPEGINIVIINDMSVQIKAQVHDLENNIISGLLLVLITLLFFMGGFRNALFVAISVPMSMLITFLVLSMLGITLNMVVLFSLILALGMLVDNAIVIVENIYRHATEGKDRMEAAREGTREVGWAVIASTATTVAAFFPMLFWPGVMGEFMGYLPLTVIITLISSLFVALVINPTLCATLLKVKPGVSYSENEIPDNMVYRSYRASLEWSLRHRWVIILAAPLALVGSCMTFGAANNGVEFFPATTPERFNVDIEMPDGTRLDTTEKLIQRLEGAVGSKPELMDAWIADAGVKSGDGGMAAGGSASHYGKITVDLVDIEHQESDPLDFMEELRQAYADVPGATVVLKKENMGPPAGEPVNIEIVGEDLRVMSDIARQVKDKIRTVPGLIDLRDDLELSRPEVHVIVDRSRAAVAGVDTRGIAQTVRTAINGTEASVFREGDEEYDIVVKLPEDKRRSIEDVSMLRIVNKDNFHIPITELATVEVRGGAGSIRHKDQDRVVTVTAGAGKGYLPAELLTEVQARVSKLDIPAGYQIRYTGENEDQKEAGDFLARALLAALFLIALILITEFNSILQPLIIVGSVLLSLIGVFLSLVIFQQPFGVIMTGIGIISLAGVVVNNSIVLIDYANKLKERGMSSYEASLTAGLVRFRPVLLTATTTVLGLAPLVLGVSLDFVNTQIVVGGRSVEMWGPMANVIVAGLLVATVLTLIVVPVLYSFFDDVSDKLKKLVLRGGAATAAVMFIALTPYIANAQDNPAQPAAQPDGTTAEVGPDGQPVQPPPGERFTTPEDLDSSKILTPAKVDLSGFQIPADREISLEEAREMVRKQNLDIEAAKAQILKADGLIRQAYSTLIPTFKAGANFIVNQEEITADISGGQPGAPPIVIQPKTNYDWTLSASLRFSFRSLAALRIAYLNKDIADVSVQETMRQLDLAVVQLYYSLLTTRKILEVAAEQLRSAKTLLEATEARRDAGTTTEFEVTRAQLRVVSSEKQITSARIGFIQTREGLANLLQTPSNFDVVFPKANTDSIDLSKLKADAISQRPDVKLADMQFEIADLYVSDVYYQYLPTFFGTFQIAGTKDTAFNPGDPRWTLILGGEWVIWDGGYREGELDRIEADRIAAEVGQRSVRSDLNAEMEQAWADYLGLVNQVESSETQVELAETAAKQANLAYQYGATTQLDVINAENSLTIARIALVQDKLAVELAIQTLYNLAGYTGVPNSQ